jgi:predicted DNA-binding protein with PD1-like motif
MEFQRTRYGYALKLDAGEDVIAGLAEFAAREGVRAGALSGIGAVGDPELGYFVRTTREYVRRTFSGEWEIGALTGNLSELDGRPFPHVHVVLGDAEFRAVTGHLFRGAVTVTCEVQIVSDPGVLRRVRRDALGFNPLDLRPRPSTD